MQPREPEQSRPISEIKAQLFRALAHPARIRVLELLSASELSVGEIQPLVGIEMSHLSQQLAVLRRAGLVTTRKAGSSVIYAIGVRGGQLSVLYPLVSLGYIFTLVWSKLFFDEPITRYKVAGLGLILVGVFLVGVGASH